MSAPAGRLAEFFFVGNYQGQGPRILCLVGPTWTDVLRKHYGITRPSFSRRSALPCEPSVDEKGHPWGWVHTPKDFLREEARWYDNKTLERLRNLLEKEMQAALGTTEQLVSS